VTTLEEARTAVQQRVDELAHRSRIELVVPDEWTTDKEWCWVFGFNSRAYYETRARSHYVLGPGPFVVEKATGKIHQLVSSRPIETQLDELRPNDSKN
jgi:hypothetical protein